MGTPFHRSSLANDIILQTERINKGNRVFLYEQEMKNLLQQEKFLRRYDKNVKEIYRRMLYDAQKEIDAFYGRYATKEGITINEAKRRVSSMDVEAFSKMAKRMVETKDFSPQANAALRLYNLTMKVNRLELLKARIGLHLVDGFDEIDKLTEMLLTNAGADEFKRQAGILGESVINPEQKAEAIARSSLSGCIKTSSAKKSQTTLEAASYKEKTRRKWRGNCDGASVSPCIMPHA